MATKNTNDFASLPLDYTEFTQDQEPRKFWDEVLTEAQMFELSEIEEFLSNINQ